MIVVSTIYFINHYHDVLKKCKQTGEPIYLTKNGEGDLVVMSIDAFEKQQALLELKERLLDIEIEQTCGAKSYNLDELDTAIREKLS